MPLTSGDLAWVRSELGPDTPPTDSDLNAAFDRLLTKEAVVLEQLRTRRAVLLAQPTSFAVPGYSQSYAGQLKSLDDQINRVLGGVESGGVTVVRMRRPDLQRRSCRWPSNVI